MEKQQETEQEPMKEANVAKLVDELATLEAQVRSFVERIVDERTERVTEDDIKEIVLNITPDMEVKVKEVISNLMPDIREMVAYEVKRHFEFLAKKLLDNLKLN